MSQDRVPPKRQFSITLDEDDYQELVRLAETRRASVAQVVREYVAAGLVRDRRLQLLVDAVEVAV